MMYNADKIIALYSICCHVFACFADLWCRAKVVCVFATKEDKIVSSSSNMRSFKVGTRTCSIAVHMRRMELQHRKVTFLLFISQLFVALVFFLRLLVGAFVKFSYDPRFLHHSAEASNLRSCAFTGAKC
jgi:hypothetical protein